VYKEMEERGEKIKWFEKKLNKWVKLFEEAEQESANRHNSVIGKINEVDMYSRKESKALQERLSKIVLGVEKSGKVDLKDDDEPLAISDGASSVSKQTATRLKKAKAKSFASPSKKQRKGSVL